MSVESVKHYLKEFGLDGKVQEFETSSATVELAAQAAGVIPARIAKSLTFKTEDGAVMIVAAGDAKVDNHKYKDTFHIKAKMLNAEEVVQYTGNSIGGVCPFALPDSGIKVYLDESMKRFESVLPAAGSSSSCIELTLEELELASHAEQWVDVCKLPETE